MISRILLTIEKFQFPSFHRAWHQEDGCDSAVPYLQNDSSGDFQHSKQCKYKEMYFSRFSKDHKGKQTSLLAKVNSRCFFLFPAAMFVPLRKTQIWCLHTKLYKFVWNIMMSNNSSTEYRTDLRLGQSPYLFIVYSVSISWLHPLNGFWFLFWWLDSESQQLVNHSKKAQERGQWWKRHPAVIQQSGFCNIHLEGIPLEWHAAHLNPSLGPLPQCLAGFPQWLMTTCLSTSEEEDRETIWRHCYIRQFLLHWW